MNVRIPAWRLGFPLGFVLVAGMLGGASTAHAAATFDPPIGTDIIENRFHQNLPSRGAAGDFNEDGKLDVVVVSGAPKLHLMLGNGNGTFVQQDILLNDSLDNTGIVRVGDVNNDGHLDIVWSDNAHGTLSVVLGDGNGGFSAPARYPVFVGMRSVALGDLNGDGWPDLIGGNCCSAAAVRLNNGDGTFGPVIPANEPFIPGNPARSDIQVADLNGDGKLDVVIGNQSQDISVLLGDGAGHLSRIALLNNGDSSANSVAVADFNGDGIPDIAANSLLTGFHVFLGNGDGTFGPFTSFTANASSPLPQWTFIIQAADLDGDGNLDLAGSNGFDRHNVSVVHGDGAGAFGPFSTHPDPIDRSVLVNPFELVAGDFNGDGKPDLMAVSSGTRKAVVMLNTSVGRRDTTPPTVSAPSPLTVECNTAGGVSTNSPAIQAWLASVTASDDVDGAVPVSNDLVAGACAVGATKTVTFSATDAAGNTGSATSTITVVDTVAPSIGSATASPGSLWPPNHRLVSVSVAVSVSDACDAGATCQILSVTSNEPVNGLGDGDTAPDWAVTGPLTVGLRAERSGKGSGRVYTITVQCSDASGNSATRDVTVTVPKSQGK